MTTQTDRFRSVREWDLPPLILHPFNHGLDAATILHSVRLSLSTCGLAEPPDTEEREVMLRGRYCELRMLCFVGRDVMRWMRQCTDFSRRDESLAGAGIAEQSFSDLLTNHTPANVAARFEQWGVVDYRHIISRGLGLNALFPMPPDFGIVSTEFLENYYSYADGLFASYQHLVPFARLEPQRFRLSLYTSDEYLRSMGASLEGETGTNV